MVQRGDAATETTSVLSTKPLSTARCQRHRDLHLCGDPDQFPTTGQTSVGSLNHLGQIGIGMYECMARSPSHAKLSVYVQAMKAAIMRHGFTWISSIGAIPNHIAKKDRQILLKERPSTSSRAASDIMSDHSLSPRTSTCCEFFCKSFEVI